MRILFYAKRNLHPPHLEPIRRWFSQNRPEVETVYASPKYVPSMEGLPGIGLSPQQVEEIRSWGAEWIPEESIQSWQPEATVLADADFGGIAWGGKIINVNHGLISKGTFYTNAPNVQRENGADLICVPGPHHAAVLQRVLRRPVKPTGFVKFDPIGRGELTQASARKQYGLPVDARVVLFAPTYNLELSAVPVLTDKVRDIISDGSWLLIKLHGMAPPVWVEMYRLLALLEERIIFIPGGDITPAIMAADVVISDVSSAFMEAISLDRPVVLVNNPLRSQFPAYDPNDIEYTWRHVGLEVSTPAEMLNGVWQSFDHPEEKADLRHKYGPMLVGPIDGKASERAASAILELIGE